MKLPVLMSIVVATMSAGSAAAANDFRTLIFEKDLNVPAEVAWHKIGGFCQFPELVGATCAMNSGTGGVGSVRTVDRRDSSVVEVMVGQSSLSYTYVHVAQDLPFYHGTLAVQPTGKRTSKIVYTFMWDEAGLSPQQKSPANDPRAALISKALDKLKTVVEAK